MQIVIISHNQVHDITLMLETLAIDNDIVYVLDRCDDGSNDYNFPYGVNVIKNNAGKGFLAGKMRDLGASRLDSSKPILFLDGDKIPSGDIRCLERFEYDAICLGINNDAREWINTGNGIIPWLVEGDLINPYNYVYSCGIYLTPKAMAVAKSRSKESRIFHEAFDGFWGEEDRYLGDVLAEAGCTIGYTSCVKLRGNITQGSEATNKMARNYMIRMKLSGRIP